jgi:predicted nucleic acid-binding protein
LSIYADSSFLLSPYVQDSHKAEFLKRIATRPAVWLTPLNRAEIANGIFLHIFYKTLKADAAANAWSEFQHDVRAGVWIPVELPSNTWMRCTELARRYSPSLGVRTLDSLHVACALELRAKKFWTFDERQAKLAEAVGLDTRP